jgi:hypothetical protein
MGGIVSQQEIHMEHLSLNPNDYPKEKIESARRAANTPAKKELPRWVVPIGVVVLIVAVAGYFLSR